MRILPLIAIGALLAATAGCTTRQNPDFCCVTSDTCAAAGLTDELRPCGAGQACKDYGCVAAECTTSSDCTSADAPACVNGFCVAGCAADDDCAGVAGRPHCDPVDATCVGCTSNDQCPADKAFCDADTRSCRGCTADDQCASGVCIEATGTCAADSEIIYVTETGTDEGNCPRSAPCKTMSFAMGLVSPGRNVIRILGAFYHLGNGALLERSIVIDGSNTILTSATSPAIHAFGPAVLEGVRLSSTEPSMPLIEISSLGILKLAQVMVDNGEIKIDSGGTLEATNLRLRSVDLECNPGGHLAVHQSYLERISFVSYCELVLYGSHLEPIPTPLTVILLLGNSQIIENNVFVATEASYHLIGIAGSAGSTFRFNTIATTSPVTSDGVAVFCEEGVNVTSNIIAYNTTRPVSCVARYSLFDVAGAHEVNRGVGNRSADIATFFRNRQAGDFHLAPNSPALGWGEPGLIAADLDGNPRPMPVGSMPDVGAYEAP